MSSLSVSKTVLLPAPTMGVDWSVPKEQVQYPYSPASLDWIANGNGVKIRDPHVLLDDTSTEGIQYMASYEAENTIMCNVNGGAKAGLCEYNVDTETLTNVSATSLFFRRTVNYQGRIFFATRTTGYSWDGTTLSAAFTGATGSVFVPPGCCIYRDRYVQVAGQTLYFAPTAGALSGALSSFNLASYYSAGDFYACGTVTIQDSSNLADYLVLLTWYGDLLAFTGDFPGSANWQLVVKTKLPVEVPFYFCDMTPYAGDLWLFVSKPAALFSVKKLIQEGRLEAERQSPIAKQINFIREADGYIGGVTVFAAQNALLIESSFDTQFNEKIFGYTPDSQVSNWLYADLTSGAVSPFSYPNFSSSVTSPQTSGCRVISHSDGYVYTENSGIYRLFDNTVTDTEEDYNTFLQFPYTNLERPDSIKTLKMAYPTMSRYGGYTEAKLAIECDYDADQVRTYDSKAGVASASNLLTERLIVPVAGQGAEISVALINKRRPRLACQRLGLQFEDGGPY